MTEIFTAIPSVATAVGVFLAARQLGLTRRQSVTTFEDSFDREYRELAATLPTRALLGEPLSGYEHQQYFDEFYHYIDLCNKQVFLNQYNRITRDTWEFWRGGIVSNLRRPAFKRAWSEIAARANNDFSELRALCPPEPREKS
ncbi:MAG: hypothetical protein HZA29_03190 [Candidatus Omnitrophica bacterium]|nr:hypothetical protein [Candidatus Omnitrophota bacterium]